MKLPYELETEAICPQCGCNHIVGEEVDYGVYLPMCLKCGYTGSENKFLSPKQTIRGENDES